MKKHQLLCTPGNGTKVLKRGVVCVGLKIWTVSNGRDSREDLGKSRAKPQERALTSGRRTLKTCEIFYFNLNRFEFLNTYFLINLVLLKIKPTQFYYVYSL